MSNSKETQTIADDAVGIDAAVWEETAEEILAESPYDSELGKRLSRDAVRVSVGQLSETEFMERHHDAIVAEFGVDDRPTGTEEDDE